MHMRNEPTVPETLSSLRRPINANGGWVEIHNRIYKQGRFTEFDKTPLDTKEVFSN